MDGNQPLFQSQVIPLQSHWWSYHPFFTPQPLQTSSHHVIHQRIVRFVHNPSHKQKLYLLGWWHQVLASTQCFVAFGVWLERKPAGRAEGLINRVDEHIRIIKSLSPSSFTLNNLYDELAVMAIIRALPHSFDDVIHTISVLDKFDKQSVIQSLRNMDQTRTNLSGTSTAFSVLSTSQKAPPKLSQASAKHHFDWKLSETAYFPLKCLKT